MRAAVLLLTICVSTPAFAQVRAVKPLVEAIARAGRGPTDDVLRALTRDAAFGQNAEVQLLVKQFAAGTLDDATRLALTAEDPQVLTVLRAMNTAKIDEVAARHVACAAGACPPGLEALDEVMKAEIKSGLGNVLEVRDDLELALTMGGSNAKAIRDGIVLTQRKLEPLAKGVYARLNGLLNGVQDADGVRAVLGRFDDVLEGLGVELAGVKVGDAFSPLIHDAKFLQPIEGVAKGHVTMVVKRGASIDGVVIRVSDVAVSP